MFCKREVKALPPQLPLIEYGLMPPILIGFDIMFLIKIGSMFVSVLQNYELFKKDRW